MAAKVKKCPKPKDLAKLVPFPKKNVNKYTRGKLTIVGGSAAYPGAACLASLAAYRMGAGYVEVVCAPETLPIIRTFDPNVVARSWDGWLPSSSKLNEADQAHPGACLMGSGLEGTPDEAALVLETLRVCRKPVVVDGGAITALATEAGRAVASLRAESGLVTVATPHFGEAARLGEPFKMKPPKAPASQPKDDARFAQQLADAYGATIVLKGSDTYIAKAQIPHSGKDDAVYQMSLGTAALAKAGTGDVLAGTIGALLAQGLDPLAAAQLGSTLHAEAGRIAAERLTAVSVCATDVAESIPAAIAALA